MNKGAILFPEYAVDSWGCSLLINSGLFDPDKKLSKYTEKEMEALLHSKPMKIKTKFGAKEVNLTFEGIVTPSSGGIAMPSEVDAGIGDNKLFF